MGKLDEKVAAITGGTRGIGRAIAEAILEEGGKVAINGRNADKGEQALAEMNAGDRAIFVQGDVMKREDCERLVDTAVATFGTIDILVNNAGGSGGFAPVAQMSDEAWLECLDWCLNHTFWCSRRALQTMERQGSGRIINISSVEGRHANKAAVSHYITNKHAINGLTRAIAFEYGAVGITCNAICPGAIETDIMQTVGPQAAEAMGITYEQFLDSYAKEASIKRLNTLEEVAAMAILLCSHAGGGINGAILDVHGGTLLA
ncbi:MAG TPA: SDR family NAD(P)-dependent oxidoreductase [Ilumatobacteraceae bacterium]|jgi:3-hydroxybutyrate dehydrogenase/3-oxoacyl-[acyl-carrier protein] reductase